MFLNPGLSVGGVGIHIYITVFYVLWGMTMTMIDVPYWSFIPTLTSNLQERNVVSAIPRFFSGLGQLTVMGATPLILNAFPADQQGRGFTFIAAGLGIMMIITSSVTAATTRERIIPKQKEAFSFRETLRTLRKNDQLLVFMVVVILFNLGWYTMNALASYFFDYVVDGENSSTYFTLFAAFSGVAQAAGLILMSPLSRRFGKQRVFKGGIIAAIAGYLALLFISTRGTINIPLFYAFDVLACLGIGCVFTAEMSMFADLVDYGEFKLGKRTESVVYSMKSFQMKFAQMAQALIMGSGLDLFGYSANAHPQPESGKTGIVLMMFLIPPILAAVALVLFSRKYKLHSEYLEEVSQAVHGD
jgi:melibiose permease